LGLNGKVSTVVISLIGLPGGGKSTVGRQLARKLGVRFVDADTALEERIGMPIRSFFEQQGEQAFRDLEEQVIEELTRPPATQTVAGAGAGVGADTDPASSLGMVLATGGGAVLRAANRQCLRERTTVVYLRSPPDELFRRLKHDTQRPLLQVADPMIKLRELYQVRHPLYEQTAHYSVDTGRPSVATLVNMIVMQLDLGEPPHP
jgi:shikimate kinase